jgi:hypothetical protein
VSGPAARRCLPAPLPAALLAFAAALVAGCGGVKIAPTMEMPKPLVVPSPARVGVVLTPEQRTFKHSEDRGGVPWEVDLSPGNGKFAELVFASAFTEARVFEDVDSARAASGLDAIFEPRVEQYSFATARETGGDYVAVTIRYRINLLTPGGDVYDTFTLTGYGNSIAGGMSSSEPLNAASRAAMRDAAAKFLTQFPLQAVAQKLARGERLVAEAAQGPASSLAALQAIQAVPVRDTRRRQLNLPSAP